MQRYTRRNTSSTVTFPTGEEERLSISSIFDFNYVVNPEFPFIPSFATMMAANPISKVKGTRGNPVYELVSSVLEKHKHILCRSTPFDGMKLTGALTEEQRTETRDSLTSLMSAKYLFGYSIFRTDALSNMNEVPSFLRNQYTKITRNEVTYIKLEGDIYYIDGRNIVPLLVYGVLSELAPILYGYGGFNTISNKQNILLFNKEAVKNLSDTYFKSRLRQHVRRIHQNGAFSLKHMNNEDFNGMLIKIPDVNIFNSLKAANDAKSNLLGTMRNMYGVETPQEVLEQGQSLENALDQLPTFNDSTDFDPDDQNGLW